MKSKIFKQLFIAIFLIISGSAFASYNYTISASGSQNGSVSCGGNINLTVSISNSAGTDPVGSWSCLCPVYYVTLYRYTAATSSFSAVSSTTATLATGGNTSGSATAVLGITPAMGVGTYSFGVSATSSGCSQCGTSSTFAPILPSTNSLFSVSAFNTPASISNFKVDGTSVNPSSYSNFYACQNLQITNIGWGGTASAYAYKVEVTKAGGSTTPTTYNWQNGTPPSTFDLKALINSNQSWTGNNFAGQYTVKFWVKNSCNTAGASYTGLLSIGAAITATTSCFKFANGSATGCVGTGVTLVTPGGYLQNVNPLNINTSATPTPTCSNSPKVNASCSGGSFVQGYWSMGVMEFDATNTWVGIPVNTGNKPLTSTADITCLNLNDYSSPLGYFYSNTSGKKYFVIFRVGNICGESMSTGWFIDNQGGCKTDGSETTTGIEELKGDEQLQLFPNPSTDELNVFYQDNSERASTFTVNDLAGRTIQLSPKSVETGKASFNVSDLSKGIYIMTVDTGNGSHLTKRFVVQ